MLLVSAAAGERLLDMLEGVRPKAGQALRLTQKTPGRLGLSIDSEREGDQVISCSQRTVLLVASELADLLSETVLIVESGRDGQHFGLRAAANDALI